VTEWVKAEPAVAPGGDVGGDVQATESYSVRFLPETEPPDGYHAVVTVSYYGARDPNAANSTAAPDEASLATLANMRRYYRPGLVAVSDSLGEVTSADPNDYFWLGSDDCLTDSEGEAMVLVMRSGERVEGQSAPGDFWVQAQWEFLICSDPSDPGGSEVWSDVRFSDYSDRFPTAEMAEQLALGLAETADGAGLRWDGRSEL
jgi:hypothetical protein